MMNRLKIRTDNEFLEWVNYPSITSGNENVDVLEVEFGPEWQLEGAVYYASFFIEDPEKTIDIELDADCSCIIPKQMLAEQGTFHFGVWAEADGRKIKTSEIIDYYVAVGIRGTDNAGVDASFVLESVESILIDNGIEGEDVVDKVKSLIDNLTKIETIIDESGVIEYDSAF